jgi:hypothetical protein
MQIFPVKIIPAIADRQWDCPPLPDSFGKKLLIISRPVPAQSPAEAMLRKMMAACKLQDSDYELLAFEEGQVPSWSCIQAAGAAPVVLLLGVEPQELTIHAVFQPYAPQAFGGRTYIMARELPELDRDPAAKKALWDQGLKPAFQL